MDLKTRAKRLKTDISAVFIAMQKKETPLLAKMVAGVIIAYTLSPIDLIPDFVPVLGYLDDIILLPVLVALVIRMIPSSVMDCCRLEAEDIWKEGSPKKWLYAIPIVMTWILLIYIVVNAII